jgi:serine/threonine protein kinase
MQVAIKMLQKDMMEAGQLERTKLEISIMRTLDHPHIVRLYDVVETPDRINMVMEYVPV